MPAPASDYTAYRVREALAAYERGWPLMPLRGKIPIETRWNTNPSPSEAEVERWATAGNVGLRTGRKSGVYVLDVDTAKGAVIPGDLPETPTVITGSGGRHYYFKAPALPLGNTTSRLGPHIDTRGDGGQVVYPGSIHPDTGTAYLWAPNLSPDDVELAEIPAWIMDKLTEAKGYAQAALRGELTRVRNACDGERNNVLNRAAFALGQLVGGGQLEEQPVVRALLDATALGIDEAVPTIRSGIEKGKQNPRTPPERPRGGTVLTPGAHIDDKANYIEVGNHTFADSVIRGLPDGRLYHRSHVPGELIGEPGSLAFVPLTGERARLLTDAHVRLGRWVAKKDNESVLVYQNCNRDLAGLITSAAETHPSVREIRFLANYPVYTAAGRVTPGLDPTGVYYDEPPALRDLRPDPQCARDVLEDLVVDFPFRSQADRENFFGLLLTPIVRPMIDGNVPMHLILSSLERTGKTKLAEDVLGGIVIGKPTPAMQLPSTDEERSKAILSLLLRGDTIAHLDNIREFLDSAALASLITAGTYTGRYLGQSKMIDVANLLSLVGTGNNVRATGEMCKRIIPIALQPASDDPQGRSDFVYPDLREHVRQVRRVVLETLLGMVDAWVAAGRPRGTVRLGGFEDWAAIVGGIMQHHGFTAWGSNLREWQRQADPEGEELKAFEAAWWDAFQGAEVSPKELLALAAREDLFLGALSRCHTDAARSAAFGKSVLARNLDRPIGESVIRMRRSGVNRRYYLDRQSDMQDAG